MNNGCWISVKRQMKDKKQAGGKVEAETGTSKGLCTSEPDEAFGRAHPWEAGQGQVRQVQDLTWNCRPVRPGYNIHGYV